MYSSLKPTDAKVAFNSGGPHQVCNCCGLRKSNGLSRASTVPLSAQFWCDISATQFILKSSQMSFGQASLWQLIGKYEWQQQHNRTTLEIKLTTVKVATLPLLKSLCKVDTFNITSPYALAPLLDTRNSTNFCLDSTVASKQTHVSAF